MAEDKDPSKEDFKFPDLHPEEEPKEPPAATPVEAAPTGPSKFSKLLAMIGAAIGALVERLRPWVLAHKTAALIIGFTLAVAAMYGISVLRREAGHDEDVPVSSGVDEVPVNAIEARLGRFQDQINAVGTLKGEAEIELRFEVDGKIEEFNVIEGGRVKKGTLIAALNQRDTLLKVERAKLELEQKEKLYQLGGVSLTDLKKARLELDAVQTELDKTKLVASRDGILGDKAAEIGEFVRPERKIATLVAIKNVVVKVGIIEKQVDKVYPGQKIIVTVDAYPGNVFEGIIESISPLIIGESKTFEATAKIPNADNLLLPGMFARAKIVTYEIDDAISVPNDALVKTEGGFQLFVVNKDNIAEARDVTVGYVATEFTQVESGLSPGEVVVIQKPPELKAGSKVKIIEMQK